MEDFNFPSFPAAAPPGVEPYFLPETIGMNPREYQPAKSRRLSRLIRLPEGEASPVRMPDGSAAGRPLRLTAGRLALYHAFIGYTLAADTEDRPQTPRDAFLLLFLASHEASTWLDSPGPGVPPLECDIEEFRAVVAEWSDTLPLLRRAQLALVSAACDLWDFHCLGRPVPVPDEDAEAQKKTKNSLPSGRRMSRKSHGCSPAATTPEKPKSSGAGPSGNTMKPRTAAGPPRESRSQTNQKPAATPSPKP